MIRLSRRAAMLGACSISGAALFGCGGGNGTTPAATGAAAAADTVALTETATDFTVTTSGTRTAHAWSAMQFMFSADVQSGTHAGSKVSGLLLLKGEAGEATGDTAVEGKLLVGTLPFAGNGIGVASQARAATTEFRTKAAALRAALRAQIDKLRVKLEADLAAATTDEAKLAARQAFTDAFKALMAQFQLDMTALVTTLSDALTALGLDPSRHLPGGADGSKRGLGHGGFTVSGTLSAGGHVTGTVALGSDQLIQVSGDKQGDGSFAGTFTGPASDDKGKWSATSVASAVPPQEPVPVPAPPASATAK